MTEHEEFTGGCLCGGTRYVCTDAPMGPGHCHCNNCKKASGTGHMSWFSVHADQIEITGPVHTYDYKGDSGYTITRHFCPTCGTHVYTTHECATTMVMLSAGGLDNPEVFKPQMVIFTMRAPSWDGVDVALPSFPGMPQKPGG